MSVTIYSFTQHTCYIGFRLSQQSHPQFALHHLNFSSIDFLASSLPLHLLKTLLNFSISNKPNMARLSLSFLLFLSLLSLSLARLHPDSAEETTHYIVVPVESSSDGRAFENLQDFGYSLRHLIGHGRRHHHHHHHGYGGFGQRFMEGQERGMDLNPGLMKPDGEWMEVPRMPMHVKHWEGKEMEKSEEYVKSDRAEEPEEDELSEEEMEKLRELMKKMRKNCRKHRMERERGMRMPHGPRHEREEREEKEERDMFMPRLSRHEREERQMHMPHLPRHEREEREMHMPRHPRHEEEVTEKREEREMYMPRLPREENEVREKREEREMHMTRLPRHEKEVREEEEEGGIIKQVWDFVSHF